MNAFIQMSKYELKLGLRNFIYVFFAFIFPPMMLLLFGGIYGNQPSEYYGGYGMVDVSTPSYMGMVLAVSGLMGLPLALAEYRQRKILKRYKATPLSSAMVMIPQFVVNIVFSVIGLVILVLVGKGVFNLQFMGSLLSFLPALLLSMACLFAMGFLIAALAPNMKAASAIAYIVYFPMLFLSGASIPLELMPDTIKTLSKVFPLTHAVEILKGTWLGQPFTDFPVPIVVLLTCTLGFSVLAAKFFRWE